MTFDYEVMSELTLVLPAGSSKYLRLQGVPATCIISVKIVDTGATCTIESAIESADYFVDTAEDDTDLLWEFIKVNGSYVPSITTDIASQILNTPSIMKVSNTSTGTQSVRFSIRGNR